MKKTAFAGAALVALAAAIPALAQPQGQARGPAAQPMTRAAVQARVQTRFARADANRDGFVTQEEVRARAEAARGELRAKAFDRLDANHDGNISRSEFETRPAARAEGPRQGMRGKRLARRGGAGMGGGLAGRAFAMMDGDRDGRVSLAEANAAALQRFDRVDANRDGTITPDERQAARAALRARMMERRGG